jgi:hypothetical protein
MKALTDILAESDARDLRTIWDALLFYLNPYLVYDYIAIYS